MPQDRFRIPGIDEYFTPSQLRRASRETQKDVMRAWFLENYTDPAENTPYETAEGGYIYIWGGPFDANEELQSKFGDLVALDRIEELANELNDIAVEWTGQPDDYIDEYVSNEPVVSQHIGAFDQSIESIRLLLSLQLAWTQQQYLLRLLYANVITALETYLSGVFRDSLKDDPLLLRKFVESTPAFSERSFKLSEFFKTSEDMNKIVEVHLAEVVWHRFDKVSKMFQSTLGIKFPDGIGDLYKAILVRHDIVHRNGSTVDGMQHRFSTEDILALSSEASKLVRSIESEWILQRVPEIDTSSGTEF